MALAHPCVFPIALRALVALFPLFGVPDSFICENLQCFCDLEEPCQRRAWTSLLTVHDFDAEAFGIGAAVRRAEELGKKAGKRSGSYTGTLGPRFGPGPFWAIFFLIFWMARGAPWPLWDIFRNFTPDKISNFFWKDFLA